MRKILEDIKTALILAPGFLGVPVLLFLHWLAFGY